MRLGLKQNHRGAFIPSLVRRGHEKVAGYTLVEVVAVIGIVLFGAVASLSAVTYSLRAITLSGERLEAAMLAQEGLEVVRNIRDNNWIRGPAFDSYLSDGLPPPDYYLVSFESPGFINLTPPTPPPPALNISDPTNNPDQVPSLYFDEPTGRYGYMNSQWANNTLPEGSTPTKFKRWVVIEKKIDDIPDPDPDAEYLKVTSWVRWGESFNQFIAVTTLLYDWRQ